MRTPRPVPGGRSRPPGAQGVARKKTFGASRTLMQYWRAKCFPSGRPGHQSPPPDPSRMIAHDSSARAHEPGCGSTQLQCIDPFTAELDRVVDAAPFVPEQMRDAALACAHEAKLQEIPIERLIAELGDCLRLRPIPRVQYAELRQQVIGWVLSVYFPAP